MVSTGCGGYCDMFASLGVVIGKVAMLEERDFEDFEF